MRPRDSEDHGRMIVALWIALTGLLGWIVISFAACAVFLRYVTP